MPVPLESHTVLDEEVVMRAEERDLAQGFACLPISHDELLTFCAVCLAIFS